MTTLPQRLHSIYQSSPDQPAIRLLYNQKPEELLTYRDLLHGAGGYAQALAEAGIQPGEVVILILQHSQSLVFSFFGAILHGSIPSIMPFLTEKLSPEQYRHSLAALFEITRPAAVVTYPEFLGEVQDSIPANSSIRRVLISTDVHPVPHLEFNQLAGLTRSEEDTVLLQHSSGTTGLQKGVALSHQAVFNQLDSYSAALRLNSEDVIVSWLPLYHDMGLIAGFIIPIISKTPLILLSPFDWVRAPYRLLQAISQYRGTLAWLPNFAYNFCAQKIRSRDLEGVDLSSWRAVINCSEPMYWSSHQMFLERFQPYGLPPESLATCYAMAENVFAVTQGGIDSPVTVDVISQRGLLTERVARPPAADELSIRMLSAGPPIANVRVRIFDDKRHELPDRHLGEIALHSNCMLSGYYQRPELTAKAFHDDWYLTGDLGYIAEGEVYVTGRKKDLIIVGGKNIYPQDLEALASEVPGVHPGRVVAFGVANENTGTEDVVIIAEIEKNRTSAANPQSIADEIRLRVTRGSDVALRFVKLVERGWLLKTSSGKVARSA
ncbi:MAG: AMP-binding protein, partial [Anaerolineales bacterium]|nr:AMP-binding protein [Anaerolineales bacterium]